MMAPRGTKRQLFMLLPAVVLFSIISALAFMSWRRMDGDAMYGWPITPDLPESVVYSSNASSWLLDIWIIHEPSPSITKRPSRYPVVTSLLNATKHYFDQLNNKNNSRIGSNTFLTHIELHVVIIINNHQEDLPAEVEDDIILGQYLSDQDTISLDGKPITLKVSVKAARSQPSVFYHSDEAYYRATNTSALLILNYSHVMSLNTMDYALGLLQVPSSTLSPSVIGVSLERPTFNYALNQTFPSDIPSSHIILQHPSSAVMFFPNGFAKLSDWFHERMKRVTKEVSEEEEWAKRMGIEYSKDVLDELWEPMVPESLSNALLSRFDWRKHLLKWMVEEGTGILVPPASLVLPSTAAEEPREQSCLGDGIDEEHCSTTGISYLTRILNSSIPTYTAFLKPVFHLTPLGLPASSTFDRCILILTVYDRISTLKDRLSHMNRFPFLDSIVLIWNNPSIPAPNLTNTTLLGSTHRHTLHILPQPKNSVNNRWIDHPDLYKRDCIITMDDDWDFPPENLFLAITAWRTQHFNRLVGYHHLGRSITTETSDNNTKTYTYIPSPDNGISIILPSGMVFHRKYMTEYWSPSLVAARQHVDDTINCDDILINMIVANVTREPPVALRVGNTEGNHNLGGCGHGRGIRHRGQSV